jgi:NAD-dependent SIR2 family protein deacetylase
MDNKSKLIDFAEHLKQADGLLITAGAGMGVDSGLPDFRGDQGFWKAYPPLKHLGKSFVDMATPELFYTNPKLAWGFMGYALMLTELSSRIKVFIYLKNDQIPCQV